jgi:iron complex outermembrane receptor protein
MVQDLRDQITFSDRFILVGSLRYDSVDFRNLGEDTDRYDQAWSPRIGLIYKPARTISLYANYSQSFRPNLGQTASGDPIAAEKGEGFEVGIKTEFLQGKMFATLAYFDITKQNVATTDPNNPFFSVGTGEQRSQGVELDIAGEILPGWNIIVNYAYTDARTTEDNDIPVGNRLFNVPYHSAGLWTTYEIQQGGLQGLGFGLGMNYVGNRAGDLANTFEVDDYFLTSLALFYKRENWRLGLNINNLFDVNYISSTNNARNFGNAPGAPFSVIGSISVEF